MDTVLSVILWILAAWFAYAATSAERRSRNWSPVTTIGAYLALFGGTSYALLWVESYYSFKLSDHSPSETTMLISGIIVLAFVVLFALDLLGKVDVMGQIQAAINKSPTGGAAGKGPSSGSF